MELAYEGSTQFMALTKPVSRNGRGTQNHSGAMIRKPPVTTNETKVIIQYLPVDVAVAIIIALLEYVKLRSIYLIVLLSV